MCCIEPKSMIGRPAWTIIARAIGDPSSCAIRPATSSWRSWSLAETAAVSATRSSSGVVLQASKAVRAAATARSTSAGVPSGTRPMTSSVAALTTSMVSCEDGWTQSPPM